MLSLENVLSDDHVRAFVQILQDDALFESGTKTAGRAAREAKSNLQGRNDKPEITRIIELARKGLMQSALLQRFAVPARLGRVLVSRYEAGMTYGAHFDDAFIGGVRTDLSFTLLLSAPEDYDGGELELMSPMGSQAIKLPAGCALVYPSDQLHAVRPVRDGVRLAVVGWIESRIASAERRNTLFELGQAIAALEIEGEAINQDALLRLKMVRNNLLRMWSASTNG